MDLTDIDEQITVIRIKNLRNLNRESIDDMLYELQSSLFKKQDEFKNLTIFNVRQQNKLLKAYEIMLFNSGDLTQKIKDQHRDDFIKAFNSNFSDKVLTIGCDKCGYKEVIDYGKLCKHNTMPKSPTDATDYGVCSKCGEWVKESGV